MLYMRFDGSFAFILHVGGVVRGPYGVKWTWCDVRIDPLHISNCIPRSAQAVGGGHADGLLGILHWKCLPVHGNTIGSRQYERMKSVLPMGVASRVC